MTVLNQVREQLAQKNLDAILITSPYNRRYVTGFTGTSGACLITEATALFITDFRYTKQASEQVKDFEIIEHKKSIEEEVNTQLEKLQVKRLGFEAEDVTFAKYKQYYDMFTPELVDTKGMIEALRLVKTESEINVIQDAASIADQAFEHILTFIKPGVQEIEVANELEFYMRKLGATSSSFDIIVASGYRSALPHGVASSKIIENGELVTMDFGALYQGYCSDITRTIAVGEINEDLKKIYNTVLEAQKRGVKHTKAGITGKEADALTRDYIQEQGYGKYFGHSTGHGLGMEVHESPSLAPRSTTTLEAGMVVTIEPGIYIEEIGGCRIEDDIVITESGNRVLTQAPKELITV